MSEYPRETQELVLFDEVTVNGVPTLDYTYQLTRKGERPTGAWTTPTSGSGGELGVMLQPVASRGDWIVWVRVAAQGGQNIVIEAGEVVRT
jgi:hypothetical protein